MDASIDRGNQKQNILLEENQIEQIDFFHNEFFFLDTLS